MAAEKETVAVPADFDKKSEKEKVDFVVVKILENVARCRADKPSHTTLTKHSLALAGAVIKELRAKGYTVEDRTAAGECVLAITAPKPPDAKERPENSEDDDIAECDAFSMIYESELTKVGEECSRAYHGEVLLNRAELVVIKLRKKGHTPKFQCAGGISYVSLPGQRIADVPKLTEGKDKPELFDETFGPYATAHQAMKDREYLMTHKGFPMVSQSRISAQKSGFLLAVTFRTRFPASLPAGSVKEELFDHVPSYDRKDEKD